MKSLGSFPDISLVMLMMFFGGCDCSRMEPNYKFKMLLSRLLDF